MAINKIDFTDALVEAGLPIIGVASDHSIVWKIPPTAQQQARANQIRNNVTSQDPTTLEEALIDNAKRANKQNKLFKALIKNGVLTQEQVDALT